MNNPDGSPRLQETFQDPRRKVAAMAAAQFGVISRKQAMAAGMSVRAIDRRLLAGEWKRSHQGIYLLEGWAPSWHRSLMVAQLWAGDSGVISHRAAAALLQLEGINQGVIEVTTTKRGTRRPPGVIVHTSRMDEADVTTFKVFRITNATRILIDLASIVDQLTLELALDSALRLRATSLPRLQWRMGILGTKGRKGVPNLRDLVEDRSTSGIPESGFETRMLRILRDADYSPDRQHRITDRGEFIARVDFAFPDRHVAIECDSFKFHSGRISWDKDVKRSSREL